MTKNPYLNALLASTYIACLVFGIQTLGQLGQSDTPLAPVLALSLFVLSAALESALFFYHPLMLFADGRHKEAVTMAVKTIVTFALVTLVLFGLVAFGV